MKTKQDYYALQAELERIAREQGYIDLTNETVDRENVLAIPGLTEADENFWGSMYAAMCDAAGMRAEEYGLNINKLLGRDIY